MNLICDCCFLQDPVMRLLHPLRLKHLWRFQVSCAHILKFIAQGNTLIASRGSNINKNRRKGVCILNVSCSSNEWNGRWIYMYFTGQDLVGWTSFCCLFWFSTGQVIWWCSTIRIAHSNIKLYLLALSKSDGLPPVLWSFSHYLH